jgi:spore maturation protein SpmA
LTPTGVVLVEVEVGAVDTAVVTVGAVVTGALVVVGALVADAVFTG